MVYTKIKNSKILKFYKSKLIKKDRLTHLKQLEAESMHIMREVVAEFSNPAMLYSVGKDSCYVTSFTKSILSSTSTLLLVHVDTTWKFKEMIEFRDKRAKEVGMELLVYINPKGAEMNISPFTHGSALHTDIMKTEGLKNIKHSKFDAVLVELDVMKKNQEQRENLLILEIKIIDGIQKIKDQNFGIFITMEDTQKVSQLEYSHYQTGQNLIFGNIFI